jgi:hypothetical protein
MKFPLYLVAPEQTWTLYLTDQEPLLSSYNRIEAAEAGLILP